MSATTRDLLEKSQPAVKDADEDAEMEEEPKIFYCSRTHSQLTQFINELRRVRLPSLAPLDPGKAVEGDVEELKHLTLGGRNKCCINAEVLKAGNAKAINEQCLDLQRPGVSRDGRCRFLPTRENQTLVHDFRDHALARVRDIEDLTGLGKRLGICPYYASRSVVRPSEASVHGWTEGHTSG